VCFDDRRDVLSCSAFAEWCAGGPGQLVHDGECGGEVWIHSHRTADPPTGPVPIAAVGRVTVDAAGNFSGTESRNVGGGFAEETITGTLTVNPDCTGTVTLNAFEAGHLARTVVLATVSDDNQKEVRMVEKSLVLPNGASIPAVVTVEAKKIFPDDEQN